jgi:hypothetical protein
VLTKFCCIDNDVDGETVCGMDAFDIAQLFGTTKQQVRFKRLIALAHPRDSSGTSGTAAVSTAVTAPTSSAT